MPGFADLSFGKAGVTTTDFGGNDDIASAIAVQADGKIVVAGFSDSVDPSYAFALARYNSDGALDTTFGIDGLVTTVFFGYSDLAYALAIQPDGKIVAAGTAYMVVGSASLDVIGKTFTISDGDTRSHTCVCR